MRDILAITNHLSIALQKKDQNIVNVIFLVVEVYVIDFCEKHGIVVLEMMISLSFQGDHGTEVKEL